MHKYGAHIFHTNNKRVWQMVNSIVEFNRYTNSPVASYKGKLYNLPFNMNTFYQMWGVTTPQQAQQIIEEQREETVQMMRSQGVLQPSKAIPKSSGAESAPCCRLSSLGGCP